MTSRHLTVLTAALEPSGYEILAVPNGATPEDRRQGTASLILLDVMMPMIDGLETCRRLKQDAVTRDIPVIFITARDETKTVVAGFQAGAVDYVTKPFRAEEIVSRVETHLEISRLTRELQRKNQELQAEMERRANGRNGLEKMRNEKLSRAFRS